MQNTIPFYIRDLAPMDFGILRGEGEEESWNQSLVDTEG